MDEAIGNSLQIGFGPVELNGVVDACKGVRPEGDPLDHFLRSVFVAVTVFAASMMTLTATAQTGADNDAVTANDRGALLRPVRTDSPRSTLKSFLEKSREFADAILEYRTNKTIDQAKYLDVLSNQVQALIDLSTIPRADRYEVGNETAMALLDIIGRVEIPELSDAPDVEQLSGQEGVASWRFPGTPIQIGLVTQGPRTGEYLFTAETVRSAPRFFRGIEDQPLRGDLPFASWTDMGLHVTGPFVPGWLDRSVPDDLQALWWDTPIWKVLLTVCLYVFFFFLGLQLFRLSRRFEPEDPFRRTLVRMIPVLALLVTANSVLPILVLNVNLSGSGADGEAAARTVALYVALSWLFWLFVRALFEWGIRSPRITEDGYDANLLRLVSGIIGGVGIILILAYGGQQLGLPVLSLLAGLGVGGLAVALAIRPTLENLISGFTLYADKPIRVGDFCSFGGQNGTVEKIGIRSTQIRALDRTLISVPNAQFADMQLVNWARCDQMLIQETIGVRYETTPDQLRFVLAEIREMLHRHPRIDPQTIRVRFVGYGDSALNIGIRIYAKTREWNDFYAIREDIYLRIYDIVVSAGSGFAFPSQTVYYGRDTGLDENARKESEEKVRSWRRAGKLPFPRLPEEQQETLEATLDYPPRGSFEAGGEDLDAAAGAELLSAEPINEEGAEEEIKREA